jgi:predicted transcriptional regulator
MKNLTKKQVRIIKLLSLGLSQVEIAKMMGTTQPCISKHIYGNLQYKKYCGRRHGGIVEKLKKRITSDNDSFKSTQIKRAEEILILLQK